MEHKSIRTGDTVGPTFQMLRPDEAAQLLGVSRAKLYKLLQADEIPSVRIGRSRRISLDALQGWIASLEAQDFKP